MLIGSGGYFGQGKAARVEVRFEIPARRDVDVQLLRGRIPPDIAAVEAPFSQCSVDSDRGGAGVYPEDPLCHGQVSDIATKLADGG